MAMSSFDSIILLLLTALVVSSTFRRLQMPTLVGYIVAGLILGPHALAWVADSQSTREIAEFGVVFLMFAIGLEFSLPRMMSMRQLVLGLGSLQVTLTLLLVLFGGVVVGMTIAESFVLGAIVAMSSTAIVIKQLSERDELLEPQGRNSVGILLMQDIAVIPILIMLPSLVNIELYDLASALVWAGFKGAFAILAIFGAGRMVLRPLFYQISAMRSMELFTLTALSITLGAAWLTHTLGLSMALGAFLAGMMLGETEFRHQIESDLRPFRDVLLGLFFISIGMLVDFKVLYLGWQWVLLMLFALIIFKSTLITILCKLFHHSTQTAVRTGLILAHGGEFGFAILALSLRYQLMPVDYAQVILGGMLLSMIAAPFMIQAQYRLVERFFGGKPTPSAHTPELSLLGQSLQKHVIICGYGRVGQNIAHFLQRGDVPYVALDLDAKRVHNAALAGDPVCYADASQYGMLEKAGIKHARCVVISFSDLHTTKKILMQIRHHSQRLTVIARCHDEYEASALYELGATEVIPETVEGSLMLAWHVLLFMNTARSDAHRWIEESRNNRYDLMRMIFPGEDGFNLDEAQGTSQALRPVFLSDNAYVLGKRLSQIPLEQLSVSITAIRRKGERHASPNRNMKLTVGDIVVLYGDWPALEKARRYLLEGTWEG